MFSLAQTLSFVVLYGAYKQKKTKDESKEGDGAEHILLLSHSLYICIYIRMRIIIAAAVGLYIIGLV